MGKRIVTSDVEIIDAVIKSFPIDSVQGWGSFNQDEINNAAHEVVRKLTAPPEKISYITGFKEDDGEDN